MAASIVFTNSGTTAGLNTGKKVVPVSRLRKEFPKHHDTLWRLVVKGRRTGRTVFDSLFETRDAAMHQIDALCDDYSKDGPITGGELFTTDLYRPIETYEDGIIDWDN